MNANLIRNWNNGIFSNQDALKPNIWQAVASSICHLGLVLAIPKELNSEIACMKADRSLNFDSCSQQRGNAAKVSRTNLCLRD